MNALRWLVLGGLTLAAPAFALGPLEANAPEVEAGMNAYDHGNYDEALKHFDAAQKTMPDNAAVQFDRGNALYKLKRYEDAQKAYEQVSKADPSALTAKDYYNLGNAWAAMQKRDEAITSYRRALMLDPRDEEARHNLEVLLRNIPPKQQTKQTGPDGGDRGDGGQDGGRPDAGPDGGQPRDAGSDGGAGDAGQPDGGQDGGSADGGASDGGSDGGADGGQGQGQGKSQNDAGSSDAGEQDQSQSQGENQDAGTADGGSESDQQQAEEQELDGGVDADHLSKQDAERLLDSMKQNEKNLQLWRFQQHKRTRRPDEKDW